MIEYYAKPGPIVEVDEKKELAWEVYMDCANDWLDQI